MVSKFATALLALYASTVAAVHPLNVSGSDFVDSVTNKRFEIVGVAYQPGGSAGYNEGSKSDPLSDSKACLRDAIMMQSLGVNCIRVYNLDPEANHDPCATIFNAAGIYMIIDVNSPLPNESINAAMPWTSYNTVYLKRIFQVVEAFKGYPNLLGFFGGNEVVNDIPSGKIDPPYIRAVTRDLKNYIKKNAARDIPVGYSAADVREILVDTWEYLQCALDGDQNDESRIDFFGLNSYSWCGGSATTQSSQYSNLITDFASTTVPVFFSEYGCNKVEPRVFEEVAALYSAEMRAVMSGGLVYEWTQESNDFGLANISSSGDLSLTVDYDNLKSQFSKLSISDLEASNSTATDLKAPKCASSLISDSSFSSNFTIPSIPSSAQSLISNGVTGGQTGKLESSVSATAMPVSVDSSAGKSISGLKLKVLSNDDSNTPSNSTSTAPTGTGSSPAASSSGVASSLGAPAGILAAGFLGMLFL